MDEGPPKEGFERLVLAHAGGLSASLDANCEHLGYIESGKKVRMTTTIGDLLDH
ncbi:MAG: hypothetical protein MZV64_00555 [Ignavibacteriales bacterium]|nr:hypothetical protein [Ignavibacteriales bacterium]